MRNLFGEKAGKRNQNIMSEFAVLLRTPSQQINLRKKHLYCAYLPVGGIIFIHPCRAFCLWPVSTPKWHCVRLPGIQEGETPMGLKLYPLVKQRTLLNIMICDGTLSGSASACCRLSQLSEAQQQMYTPRERKKGYVKMIKRNGKRCTVRVREGGGKIKPSRLTTTLSLESLERWLKV